MWTILTVALAGVLVFGMTTGAGAQTKEPRFPDLKREQMTDAQKRVYDEIAGSRGSVRGPFGPLLRSPELADRWQRLGEYVRYKTSLPARLNEFAILITARFWGSKYEWYAHKPLAIKGGLAEAIAEDLAQNKRPANMKADEELVYDFCTVLHRQHFVDDELFQSRHADARRARRDRPGRSQWILCCGFHGTECSRNSDPPGEKSPW